MKEGYESAKEAPLYTSVRFSGRGSFRMIYAAALAVLLAGLWVAKEAGTAADLQMRRDMVRQVTEIAAAVNPSNVRGLSFTAADKNRPGFQRLCAQLRAYAEAAGLNRLYTMALRDGQIVFGPGNFPEGHPYAVSPGMIYERSSRKGIELFETGSLQIQGPHSGEYGMFVTALAPVFDPYTGEVLAAVGIDEDASAWRAAVRRAQWVPGGITLALLLVLLLNWLTLKHRHHFSPQRNGRRRHAETVLAAVFMSLLTLVLTIKFRQAECEVRRNTFRQLARTHAAACTEEFYDLHSRIEQLVCFFESGREVTREGFSAYCKNMVQQNSLQACVWMPAVPDKDAVSFVQAARTAGLPDFSIWQKNKEGVNKPALSRPVYYPALYIEPQTGREASLGYDFNSEPVRSAAVQEAMQTGLAAATDPVEFVLPSGVSPRFFIFQRVDSPVQKGLVTFVVRPENLLGRARYHNGKNLGVNICLFQLKCGETPLFMAGSSSQCGLPCWENEEPFLNLTLPVFRFGKAYALRLQPDPSWLAAHPLKQGRIAGSFGLLITVLLSLVVALVTNRRINLEKLVEQRTAELQTSESRYRLLAENIQDVITVFSLDGKALYASPSVETVLGYAPEEFRGTDMYELIHPEDRPGLEKAMTILAKDGSVVHEARFRSRSGQYVWLATSVKMLHSDSGEPQELICSSRNITERKRTEEALRTSQQILEGIINAIPVRVFWKDRNLVYLGCNVAFARDAGFADPKDVVGKDDYQLGWRDQAELNRGDDREVIGSGRSKFFIEEPMTTPDGKKITILTSKMPLLSSDGKICGVLETYMDITDRKLAEERIHQLAQHLETVREDERKRISRELHDDLGQILTALKIDLVMAADECSCTGGTKNRMHAMQGLLSDGIQSVHSLCRRLRPGALDDLGLNEALAGLVEDWKQRNKIECAFCSNADGEVLSDGIKTTVFRLVQEALTNVSRYAHASRVEINLTTDEQTISLSIADNGCGMESGAENKPSSFGLLGMRERVEALGGNLCIESTPGSGTRIKVNIPPAEAGA
jgi:PAS domain S-box-containing protein